MASRYEVLEYLRVQPYGRQSQKEIQRMFSELLPYDKDGGGTRCVISELLHSGLVWAYQEFEEDGKLKWLPLKLGERARGKKIVVLSKRAKQWLKKWNLDSFYDLGRAKLIEQRLKGCSNPKYRREFIPTWKFVGGIGREGSEYIPPGVEGLKPQREKFKGPVPAKSKKMGKRKKKIRGTDKLTVNPALKGKWKKFKRLMKEGEMVRADRVKKEIDRLLRC